MDGVGFAGWMEVIERPCGRRTWPVETKLRGMAESCVPGATVGEVARRHRLQPGQVTTWAAALPAAGAGAAGQPAAAASRGRARAGGPGVVRTGSRA